MLQCMVISKIFAISNAGEIYLQTKKTILNRLQKFRTPILFVLYFLLIWLAIFTWRFQITAQESDIKEATELWIKCLLINYAKGINDPATNPLANTSLIDKYVQSGSGCGSNFPITINLTSMEFMHYIALSQGTLSFIVFGIRYDVYKIWKNALCSQLNDKTKNNQDDSNTHNQKNNMKIVDMNIFVDSHSQPRELSSSLSNGESKPNSL